MEDAEVRNIAAPGEWSGQGLQDKGVALMQTSVQELQGMPPLQDSTAVAPEPRAVSWQTKAVLTMNAGDGVKKEATSGFPIDSAAASGGVETPT